MATIKRFEDIESWELARSLTHNIYQKDYGLCNQIQRASVSVMSNIAEGFERDGNKEFCNFLSIAKGSIGEVRSQLYVALDQQYISKEEFETLFNRANDIGRLIAGLMNYLRESEIKGLKYRS